MTPCPEFSQQVFDRLGGEDMFTLLTKAYGFGSSIDQVQAPDPRAHGAVVVPMVIKKAWCSIGKDKVFIVHQAKFIGVHLVAFEYRPAHMSIRGIMLNLLMMFKPNTSMFRKCYSLPVSLEDLSDADLKKIFRGLTGIEIDLW